MSNSQTRSNLEQRLVEIILSDKYADTKIYLIQKALKEAGWKPPQTKKVVIGINQ